jgi:thiol-disulfide isomerase/thioredoxin
MVGVGAIGLLVWLLVPNPFVRGLVLGFALAPAVLLGAGALVARRLKRRLGQHIEPPPLPTAAWDYQLRGEDLAGDPVDFSEFAGRVLVLNVWATWCAPCVAELPSLARLQASLTEEGVSLACVTSEARDKVLAFVESRGLSVPVYVVAEVPTSFSSRAIPATYVVDRSGRIAFRHVGAAAWDDPGVVEFIRRIATAPVL